MLALIERILAVLLNVLGVVSGLQSANQRTAVEHAAYAIETIAANAANTVNHPTHGNAAILTAINALATAIAGSRLDILNEITSLPAPPTPPTVGAIASGIWAEVDADSGFEHFTRGYELTLAGMMAEAFDDGAGFPVRGCMHFTAEYKDQPIGNVYKLNFIPSPDWASILPTDTRLSWLTRTEPTFDWSYVPFSQTVWGVSNDSNSDGAYFTFDLTEQEFQLIGGITPRTGEPIWPGIANVTLGTPVDISDTFSTWEECHGVLVVIDTWPPKYQTYDWGSDTQHPRAGYLTFRTDNNDLTEVRGFTFTGECIMVRGMVKAVGFLGRAKAGVTGTVTPFTITAP